MKPKISVCLPCYNGSDFIGECVEAIQQQTLFEWELIIVDDQSTDNTHELALEMAKYDERIKVYRNESNLGLVGNWNKCLEYVDTSWIKYVFQDDTILPDCLEYLYNQCLINSVRVGICNRRYVMEADADPGVKKYILNDLIKLDKYKKEDGVFSKTEIADITSNHPLLNIFGEPTSLLFHESLIEIYGNYNQDLSQIVDYDFTLRLVANEGCFWSYKPLNFFRIHGGNQTNINKGDQRSEAKRLKIEFIDAILLLHSMLYDDVYLPLVKQEHHKEVIFSKYLAEIAKGIDQLGEDEFRKLIEPYNDRYPNILKDIKNVSEVVS